MHMHYSTITTLTYTSSWRKQHGVLNMLHLSNPSNETGMAQEHGKHSPANTLGKTSGKLKSRSKNNYCTHVSGRDRAISCLSTSFPNIAMHTYLCQPVLNTFNTSYQMNILVLVFFSMQSSVVMQDYRPQWLVSRWTMVYMVYETTLREPSHICYHMTP